MAQKKTPETLVDLLLEFSRVAARGDEPEALLPILAEAAVTHVGADASAVLRLSGDGLLELFASQGLPEHVAGFRMEADAIDAELGDALRSAIGDRFARAFTLPLVGDQAMFGALVLLFEADRDVDEGSARLASSLVDLAAITMGRAHQVASLQRAYDELRESREAQARSYKLGVLGQMAAGISHDLKNILNPLKIYLQLLGRQVEKGDHEQAQESIVQMHEAIARGVETIDRLREFSRQEPTRGALTVDLNAHTEEAVKLARARLVGNRTPRMFLRERLGDPPPVRVVPAELIGALVNLILNAMDALQETGGEILVTTGSAEDGSAWVRVADDGPGIPEEVARHVFEPFFTTKGHQGTGLGLANVYAFARRHGGNVRLDRGHRPGASFTILLPAAEE